MLAATLGSAAFVAVVGGGILWARFDGAELPADQAVAAVPNSELVVVGAVALVGFVIASIAALVLVYVLNDSGTANSETRRGLIVLMVLGIGVAVIAQGFKWWETALLLCAFATAGVFLAYLLDDVGRFFTARSPGQSRLPVLARWARDRIWVPEKLLEALRRLAALLLLLAGIWIVGWNREFGLVLFWLLGLVVLLAPSVARRQERTALRQVLTVTLIVYGVVALIRLEEPLAVMTGTALALGLVNLAVARATGNRFEFYGVAVLLSVVLFGGVLSYTRTREHPKLQAVAALLKDDERAVCGLYVTETDSRLYLARVEIVPGEETGKVELSSGRLFWLPRDQVTRSELGPLQGIAVAQDRAAELRAELLAEQPPKAKPAKVADDRPPVAGVGAEAANANDCLPSQPSIPPRDTDERKLALKFQPRLIVDREDRFWPISALTMFRLRRGERRSCRQIFDACLPTQRPSQLPWLGGIGEWLEYPGSHKDLDEQHEVMISALRSRDPNKSAREYFFVTEGDRGLTSLQYWFYYHFNYLRVGPKGIALGKAGFHEGDFETVGLLLSRQTKKPVYVWMARHDKEGRPFAWSEPQLQHPSDHLTVYAARGSHASYESCGQQRRSQLPAGLINDRPACKESRQLVFEPQITPLSDLAFAPWACWHGRFGHANRRNVPGIKDVFANGPHSPLWQQKFDRTFEPCALTSAEPPRPDAGEEVLDDDTAQWLRERGGQLGGLFDRCEDWRKPPASGIYVVACNQAVLGSFFQSGLEETGDEQITVAPGGRRPRAETVPAVFRSASAEQLDGVALSAEKETSADLYAVCYSGEDAVVADFRAVPVGREPWLLRTGAKTWTLTRSGQVRSAVPKTEAKRAHCDRAKK